MLTPVQSFVIYSFGPRYWGWVCVFVLGMYYVLGCLAAMVMVMVMVVCWGKAVEVGEECAL